MRSQVIIENPVIDSPYAEPTRHFKFTDEGITDEIAEGLRRESAYFVPIARPRKRSKQLSIETEWTQDRIEPNRLVNQIRERVGIWRKGNYRDVTRTTARLLEYWQRRDRERRLFFCQVEALETAIYLTEVASRYGDAWIENELREANAEANPLLSRMAFKMATGSGKTVVMAMLIAWHVLNKLANPQDARFSDTFLVVTPGITVRDRLRVLLPSDPNNYYAHHDVAPAELREELGKARIVVTNFHGFLPRERTAAGKLTKAILTLIVEVSGEPRRDKAAKVATARNLWIPAVNSDGRFGRWAFVEVTDPWDAKNTIRAAIDGLLAADTI